MEKGPSIPEPKPSIVAETALTDQLDNLGIEFTLDRERNGTFVITIENDVGGEASDMIEHLKLERKFSGNTENHWLEHINKSGDQSKLIIYYNQPD